MPASPLSDPEWNVLVVEVARQRLTGLLVAALQAGAFPATSRQRETAVALHRRGLAVSLAIEQGLLLIADSFQRSDVEYRLLKGSAFANAFYDRVSLRLFSDLDLLVPGERFDAAAQALQALGATRRFAEPRRGFDRRFSKGASFSMPNGLEVDLHRTLVLGPFGLTVDLDDLFARSSSVEVAGRTIPTLAPEHCFVHATMHAALGDRPPRLVPLRDVAQIAFCDGFDLTVARSVAKRWRVEAPMAFAVNTAWRTLALPPHPVSEWAKSYIPPRREAEALELYTGAQRNYRTLTLAAVRVVPGVRLKVAYVASLALPYPSYLASRGGSYVTRFRQGLDVARRLRRRT